MDVLIYYDHVINTQDGGTMRNTTIHDWLILEDPIRAHVATIDANLDGKFMDLALSDILKMLKLAMSIGSMKAHNGSCELFEVEISELWENFNATPDRNPKGVTS